MIVVIEGESYKPYLGFRIFRVKGSGFKVLGLGVGCQIIRGGGQRYGVFFGVVTVIRPLGHPKRDQNLTTYGAKW